MCANILDRLTNTLDIIVRSGSDSGPNIASDSPVFHTSTSSSSTSEKHKQKRAVSRPVNQCAAGQTFDYSLCIPQTSAQAYVLVCSYDDEDGTPNYIQSYLACEPYEICVEEESDGLAFCVSEVNFKLIQQAQTGGVTSAYYASHILTPSQQQQLGQTGVVATLVDLDNTTSVFAQRILLEAEGSLSTAHAGGTISLYAHLYHLFIHWLQPLIIIVILLSSLMALMTAPTVIALGLIRYRREPSPSVLQFGCQQL